jgi:hypothetical protein
MAKSQTAARRNAEVQRFALGPVIWDMGAFGLIHYASDFAAAARLIPVPDGFAPVRYFLSCHAVELGLKAFLALKGEEVIDLIDLGHRLTPTLDAALTKNLLDMVPLTAVQQAEIRNASEHYNGKVFEYPALPVMITGFADRPDVDVLMNAADVLVAALWAPCRDKANA